MEVVVNSPVSQDEEELSQQEVAVPGLDISVADVNQPDSPIAGAVSPYSRGSSPDSPEQSSCSNEIGPATPSGEQSRDASESFSASNGPEVVSQDEESQQRLQRTPSSQGEVGEEESASGDAESEKNEVSVDASSYSMDAPVTQEEGEVTEELPDPSSPFPSTVLPGLDFGEEPSAIAGYVPGLGSPNKAPQESKGMYAFLSTGQDDEEEEEEQVEPQEKEGEEKERPVEESIPFLGDSSLPSPGEEEEPEATEVEPEKETTAEEEMQEAPEANGSAMETQVLSEVEEEVVTEVVSQVAGAVEEQMDVVEQVVETSEIAEINGSEVVANVENVDPVVKEEKEAEETTGTKEALKDMTEEAPEETTQEAPKGTSEEPQQIVEEVFLTTDDAPKDQGSGESDFEGFEASEATPKPTRKRRARVIDDDDEEEGEESDFEGFEPEENKKGDRQGLIADIFDIFGHSDDEGEFDGFVEAEVPPAGQEVTPESEEAAKSASKEGKGDEDEDDDDVQKKKKKKKEGDSSSSSSEDEGPDDRPHPSISMMSDFESMMFRKKEENRKRRRRRGDNIDNLNVNDDLVVALISDMKMAASQDRDLVMQKLPAIHKLRMLPQVVGMLRKSDLQMSLIDCGVLSAITEWLSPLPDRSLPALPIRRSLLQALTQLPGIGADSLKESGAGKAVMYLNKHPKEVGDNRKIAGKLIYNWSRPIFDLTCDYKLLSKEERQKRDMDNLPKKRSITASDSTPKRDIDKEMSGDNRPLRPGDPGWVARARVPLPSNKDYVVRPRSKVDNASDEAAPPRKVGRFEKHIRKIKDSKGKIKFQKAVGMSLEGRKMAL